MKRLLIILLLTGMIMFTACEKTPEISGPGPGECPPCPQYVSPSPDFCKNGEIRTALDECGCISKAICVNQTNQTNTTQIANPASKFCVEHGGTLEIGTASNNSQIGYCKIKDKKCEEWALFRGECPKVHICTDTEKTAEACTMEYMPVCGSDEVTYGNKCSACATKIDYWTSGECPIKQCDPCPQFVSPGPDWCESGTIVLGQRDKCGCSGAPTCIPSLFDKLSCEQDTDCTCGGKDLENGRCFMGNVNYYNTNVNKTAVCYDFCSGFDGKARPACIDGKCKIVRPDVCFQNNGQCCLGDVCATTTVMCINNTTPNVTGCSDACTPIVECI